MSESVLEQSNIIKPVNTELISSLRATVKQYAMFEPGQTVIVGASGGPDSTALLHALAALRGEWQLSLVACHVNHGFRGSEAEAEADYVRELCARLNVPCHVLAADVSALQKRRHLSVQEAARLVRHRFLRKISDEVGAVRIALAHTRDDRVESILLNLLRGSGLEGLSGFAPVNLPLVRPLYAISRANIEAYCTLHELNPCHDSSNAKTVYRRNRVRLELLPELRARFNPKVDEALLRMADMAREDNDYLDQSAAEALDRLLAPLSSEELEQTDVIILPLDAFQVLPIALQRRVLRQAILRMRGHLQNISFEFIEKFVAAKAADYHAADDKTRETSNPKIGNRDEGAGETEERAKESSSYSAELPAAGSAIIRIIRDRQHIKIVKESARASALDWQVVLNTSERTIIPQANVNIGVYSCLLQDLPSLQSEIASSNHKMMAIWDRASLTLPLAARSWRPGDRMRPRGLGGSKKIQDLFIDAKIPVRERRHTLLLTDNAGQGRILALGGWRVDETTLLTMRLPALVNSVSLPALMNGVSQKAKELILVVWEYE